MKTLGLIGGTGWVSTLEYYRIINRTVNERLGGLHSARCMIYSLNFAELDERKSAQDDEAVYTLFCDAARTLELAGAEGLMICANTPHVYADRLENDISVPLIHIAEATAEQIKSQHIDKVGLLGTQLTMEEAFYTSRLRQHKIEPLIPNLEEREYINHSIFNEFLLEEFKPQTKQRFLDIISELIKKGAQGIILGCTEIPLIIQQEDVKVPILNTLEIHAKAAVDFALK